MRIGIDDDLLWFAAPPRTRTGPLDEDDLMRIIELCRLDHDDIVDHAWGSSGPPWRLVQLRDADAVRSVRPVQDRGDLRVGLVGLEQPGSPTAYEVRALGGNYEDPVTASLHGSMAQWLRERGLVPSRYVASQGSQVGRSGRVQVRDEAGQVWIGGTARIVVEGTIGLG